MRVGLAAILVLLLGLMSLASSAAKAAPRAEEPRATAVEAAQEPDLAAHPALSANGTWAGAMVLICLGLFGAAAVIGFIVDASRGEELAPDPHADAHGADAHAPHAGHH